MHNIQKTVFPTSKTLHPRHRGPPLKLTSNPKFFCPPSIPHQALRVSGGIAAACAELHSKGVMHGDIYGHNILWRSSDGQSLLGDFGAATPTKGLDAADKEGLQRLEVSFSRVGMFWGKG
jgi:serine/threonine protein kinase